jgi:hypothetical protein
VTADTTDPLLDVDAMVEIDELGKVMDSLPFNGLAGSITFPHGFQHGAADPDLGMAVHTGFGGRNPGEGRVLHGGMAIPAIDAKLTDMMLVAKRDRLKPGHVGGGDIGGTIDHDQYPSQRCQNEKRAENAHFG